MLVDLIIYKFRCSATGHATVKNEDIERRVQTRRNGSQAAKRLVSNQDSDFRSQGFSQRFVASRDTQKRFCLHSLRLYWQCVSVQDEHRQFHRELTL